MSVLPEDKLKIDQEILDEIQRYSSSAMDLAAGTTVETKMPELPEDWPLIEALFMIPYVESVDAFIKVKSEVETGKTLPGDLLESVNMKVVVEAARRVDLETLSDPIKAEVNIRH